MEIKSYIAKDTSPAPVVAISLD
ncbi:uncharacterized protein G2W53_038208 [Senna tora]|uniref:Uncharacterized protein n=1 Tax=Senna tora TaxID=362788 RepID=A0A834W1Q1_9FABA|nr:uncharacterized protein G2W53_038208 [Senna tora]